jgi:hypothetical protein
MVLSSPFPNFLDEKSTNVYFYRFKVGERGNVIDRGIHDKNDTFSFIYNELINYSGNLIPPENPGDKRGKSGKKQH